MPTREVSARLIAIDDDPGTLELIQETLADIGLEIKTYLDPEAGLAAILSEQPDIAVIDLIMPGHDGMQMLGTVVLKSPQTEVLLLTGHYSTESAAEAIQKGACDYLIKPISVPDFRLRISRLTSETLRRNKALKLDDELFSMHRFEGMVGQSQIMRDLFAQIRRISSHFRSALITGATGTGKELVARALHSMSPVSSGPFVDFNCSALVETLFESELFGYVKGAFTGAQAPRMGLFEYADNGVLFLDELGDMPLNLQSKLLRSLQNQEVRRVGSVTSNKVNVRVVAATNRDLPKMIAQGTFREELYYRLSMVELKVPRLADRKEDIPLLVRHFIEYFNKLYDKNIKGLTPKALAAVSRYSWPGNVRDLENAIGAACMMAENTLIDVRDLQESIKNPPSHTSPEDGEAVLSLEDMDRKYVRATLKRMRGNKVRTAEALGISRATLYRLLEKAYDDEKAEAQSG